MELDKIANHYGWFKESVKDRNYYRYSKGKTKIDIYRNGTIRLLHGGGQEYFYNVTREQVIRKFQVSGSFKNDKAYKPFKSKNIVRAKDPKVYGLDTVLDFSKLHKGKTIRQLLSSRRLQDVTYVTDYLYYEFQKPDNQHKGFDQEVLNLIESTVRAREKYIEERTNQKLSIKIEEDKKQRKIRIMEQKLAEERAKEEKKLDRKIYRNSPDPLSCARKVTDDPKPTVPKINYEDLWLLEQKYMKEN